MQPAEIMDYSAFEKIGFFGSKILKDFFSDVLGKIEISRYYAY